MIIQAETKHLSPLLSLVTQLWGLSEAVYFDIYQELLSNPETALFLYQGPDEFWGFAQCQLRHDYVEGTASSPVGYLEGIYVIASQRRKGVAGELLAACQNWASAKGCVEFASDCELENDQSYQFHLRHGFIEANRIICFKKSLSDAS